jgi:hypothetical protein
MITVKNIESWENLIEELEALEKSCGDRAEKLLYRGQADSEWELKTTLERKLKTPVSLGRYYRFAYSAKTKIETFTDATWGDIPTPQQYDKWVENKDTLSFSPLPAYDYLAYLRHHGFPSPFLDWSASPYIAIFFAFNCCSKDIGTVALYCFLEHASVAKIRSSDQPEIYVFGPYVKAHRRHVLQQSQYSICVELDDDYKPIYANHEQVFTKGDEGQDRLWKFNIPVTERAKVLRMLNRMNINSFSLFGSADSLVETIATNEIIKNEL